MVLNVLHYSMYRTDWNYQFNDSFLLQTTSTLIWDYDSFALVCLVLSTVAINLFVYKWMLVKIAYVCTCVCTHTCTYLCMCVSVLPSTAQASLKLISPEPTRQCVITSCAVKSQRHEHGSYTAQSGWSPGWPHSSSDSLLHCFSMRHHSELQDGITTSVLYTKMSPNMENWWAIDSWAWPTILSGC